VPKAHIYRYQRPATGAFGYKNNAEGIFLLFVLWGTTFTTANGLRLALEEKPYEI
jgi:hypothetical protein